MAVLLVGIASASSAQSRPGALSGRWRVEVANLSPQPLAGELILRDSAGALRGSLLLSNHQGGPVELDGLSAAADGRLVFTLPGEPRLTFTGRGQRLRMDGQVSADSGGKGRWVATRLDPSIPFYPVLPRFRLVQIIGGSGASSGVLPARMAAVALNTDRRAELTSRYWQVAAAAGLAPLPPERLPSGSPARVMGLASRDTTLALAQGTLERLRAELPSDSLRREFDQVFRPRGTWVLDLHGAALDIARLGNRRVTWAAVGPALVASGWLREVGPDIDLMAPAAVQGLRMLVVADSAAARALITQARTAVPESADALMLLLRAYPYAEAWHRRAITFLLTAPWVASGGSTISPATLVQHMWRSMRPDDPDRAARVPRILSANFGQPQAVPRSGSPARGVGGLVQPLNWTGAEWVRRNGTEQLLAVVRQLDGIGPSDLLVERRGEPVRVVSVGRRARESSSGFLESQDAIVVEPSYMPVFALGAVLHEWGHLLVEGWRFERAMATRDSAEITLPEINPWLNEGSAEAWTDLVLSDIVPRYPLMGLSEAEKRARIALADPADAHVAGYLMVRAMLGTPNGVKVGPGSVLGRLVEDDDPASVLDDRILSSAFPGRGQQDFRAPLASRRFLVPETVFTIEDFVPDVVTTTIRTGP